MQDESHAPQRAAIEAAVKRTAFQKKAVSRLSAAEVLDLALAHFREHGYRTGRTGRPNQIFVLGGREGEIPRVNGEISARADVGRPGVTLVTMDGFGERLGPTMQAFHAELRRRRAQASRRVGSEDPDRDQPSGAG
jgi:predicted HTH domain antitoxin